VNRADREAVSSSGEQHRTCQSHADAARSATMSSSDNVVGVSPGT
jgi:hypothetical protein